jgi:hypothetical protein
MFYLYEKIRVAARSGALDCIGCARLRVTALEFHGAGMKRWRLGRRVKHGLRGVRSISAHALDRIGVRSLLPVFERRRALLVVALDRRCSAIERTNRGFTHLSSILPFKPRLHNKDLQHNKTLK